MNGQQSTLFTLVAMVPALVLKEDGYCGYSDGFAAQRYYNDTNDSLDRGGFRTQLYINPES